MILPCFFDMLLNNQNNLTTGTTYHLDLKMKKNLKDFKMVDDLVKISGLKRAQWL